MKVGDTRDLVFVVRSAESIQLSYLTIGWTSTSGSVVTVSGFGVATAHGTGEATITGYIGGLNSNPIDVLVASVQDDFAGGSLTFYTGTLPDLSTSPPTGTALVAVPINAGDLVWYLDTDGYNVFLNVVSLVGYVSVSGQPGYARIVDSSGGHAMDFTVGGYGADIVLNGTPDWRVGDRVEIARIRIREQDDGSPPGVFGSLLNILVGWWDYAFGR